MMLQAVCQWLVVLDVFLMLAMHVKSDAENKRSVSSYVASLAATLLVATVFYFAGSFSQILR